MFEVIDFIILPQILFKNIFQIKTLHIMFSNTCLYSFFCIKFY